jgi:hypothetical protein
VAIVVNEMTVEPAPAPPAPAVDARTSAQERPGSETDRAAELRRLAARHAARLARVRAH